MNVFKLKYLVFLIFVLWPSTGFGGFRLPAPLISSRVVWYNDAAYAKARSIVARVREEYPSGSAAAQAASFLERLAAQGN